MTMKDAKKSLKVALRGMDSRTVKTMKLFLFGPCNGAAEVVANPEEAEVHIFDLDISTSKMILDQLIDSLPAKPIIVLSVRDFQHENVLYTKKPVNTESMQKTLALAKSQLLELEKINSRKEKMEAVNVLNESANKTSDIIKNYVDPKVVDILKDVDDWFDF